MRRGGGGGGVDHLVVIVHTIYVDRYVVSQRKWTNGMERDWKRQRRKVIPTHVFDVQGACQPV